MTVVKLERRLLGFAWIFFAVSSAASHTVPEKNDFWVGEIIFNSWRVAAAGICWDWQAAWKKVIFGLGKSFCEIGEWRLLGFAGVFCVVYCYLADCPGRGSHFSEIGEWRLLGLAGISSFTVSTAAWRAARKKMIFGSGKSFF